MYKVIENLYFFCLKPNPICRWLYKTKDQISGMLCSVRYTCFFSLFDYIALMKTSAFCSLLLLLLLFGEALPDVELLTFVAARLSKPVGKQKITIISGLSPRQTFG